MRQLLEAFIAILFISACLAGLLLAYGCGSPKLLPPNTEQACTRGVKCQAIAADDWGQCVTCLEHIKPADQQAIDEYLKDHAINDLPCETLRGFIVLSNLPLCIAEHWEWRPK